jgi:hypothetical protein
VQIVTRVPLSLYLGPRLVNVVSLRKQPNSLYLQHKLSPYPDALQHLFPPPPVLRQLLPLNSGFTRRTSLRSTAASSATSAESSANSLSSLLPQARRRPRSQLRQPACPGCRPSGGGGRVQQLGGGVLLGGGGGLVVAKPACACANGVTARLVVTACTPRLGTDQTRAGRRLVLEGRLLPATATTPPRAPAPGPAQPAAHAPAVPGAGPGLSQAARVGLRSPPPNRLDTERMVVTSAAKS